MEDKILELHEADVSFNEVSRLLEIPRTSLARLENRLSIRLRREREISPLSDKDYFLTQLHLDISTANKKFGAKKVEWWEGVHGHRFKRLTLEERAKSEEHYFDIIDSNEKAYILGLIWTDGCVHEKKDGGAIVRISLNVKDSELLDSIERTLGIGARKVKEVDNTDNYTIYSSYMARVLSNRYGCIPNKSLTVSWPSNVPKQYAASFLRGCFDGDGGVYRDKIEFVSGSKEFFYHVLNNLSSLFTREPKVVIDTYGNRKNPLYRLVLTGKDVSVMKYVFESPTTISMRRKSEAYAQFWKEKARMS